MFNPKELINISKEAQKFGAKVVVVTKNRTLETLQQVYDSGYNEFGENRVQELLTKQSQLPKDIEWHMIGHLQRNKVKQIASFISMIHSVDSFKLLKEINKQANLNDRVIPCLLQIHIAEEQSKFGLDEKELKELLTSDEFLKMKNIQVCGIMGMATFTDDEEQVKTEFQFLTKLFKETKSTCFDQQDDFKEISMGMSGDYKIALECGSTMVRVGSLVFKCTSLK